MRAAELYAKMAELSQGGASFVVATVIESIGSSPRKTGAKMLVLADGVTIETVGGGALERQVVHDALACLTSGVSETRQYDLKPVGEHATGMICGGEAKVFLEVNAPAKTLLIVGAGHVGEKLAAMAKLLDFRVAVIDSREEVVTAARFPQADVLICEHPGKTAESFPISESTHVVIVTHTHVHDKDALRSVIDSPAAYIGMMGSRRKVDTIFSELVAEGLDASKLKRVHSPIGLDTGGQTPAELSVSILAEIIAADNGRLEGLTRSRTADAGKSSDV
ncbi:MAG TPA: XdhC/CoxI family protein [Thermoleophilia bacterium]